MALLPVNPEARVLRIVAPLAWTAGLLGLSRAAACVRIAPVLGLLRGPLGLLLVALAVGLALAAALPRPRRIAPSPGLLFGAAWALLLVVGLSYTLRLRVSGDEPHYLLMAQSLWREHDLDLRDNHARQDWREYTPGPITPHYGAPRVDGRPYPAHSPGLALLLAPLYALGGRPLCVIAMTLAAAGLSLEMWKAARRLTSDDEASLLAWSLALVPPVAFYAFEIYTEVPASLALAVSLRLLLSGPGAAGAVGAALLASALPWLHLKMMPAALALALVALVRLRGPARVAFLAVAAAMGAGFLLYYRAIFGVASPLAIYGGLPRDADGSPLRALAGLFLDRSFGLLPYAPVFLIALAGLGRLVRLRAWEPLLVGAAVIAPVLPWRMWWGGQCPPARFLVPLVPVLALALAARVAVSRTGLARWRWPLALLGIATTIGMTIRPAALLLLNRGDRPTRLWAALSGERPIGTYLPSLVSASSDEWRVALVWLAALALLLGLDVAARRRERIDRLFRGLGLPIVLLLVVGMAVDDWARRTPPETMKAVTPDEAPE
ncbi:MAG TPA: hypothetical protein VFT38_12460 [Vicinamibacteria bacterium]|nr:hypothetical protein [Vicinamibacteria bacterium]